MDGMSRRPPLTPQPHRPVGAKKSRRQSPFAVGLLQCIGTLGTEARDAEDPKDDFPDKWAFYLADDVLLQVLPWACVIVMDV